MHKVINKFTLLFDCASHISTVNLCLIKHHAMKVCEDVEVQIHAFVTAA